MPKMTDIRIFIAGHVIDTSDTERAEIRRKMTETAEFMETIGFDVVNPVHFLDETGDRNDLLCRYFRELLDCNCYYEFDDYMEHAECHIASLTAIAMNITPIRAEWSLLNRVQQLTNAIASVMGVPFENYSIKGKTSGARTKTNQQARTIFVYVCNQKFGLGYDDIARFLHLDATNQATINQINRDIENYDRNFGDMDAKKLTNDQWEFRDYVKRIMLNIE